LYNEWYYISNLTLKLNVIFMKAFFLSFHISLLKGIYDVLSITKKRYNNII